MMIIVVVFTGLTGCESSPLGPDIADRDYDSDSADTDGGSISSGGQPDQNAGGTTDGAVDVDDTIDPTVYVADGVTESCSRTTGHNVYYSGSDISLVYTCTRDIAEVAVTSSPSFFSTPGISGATVSYTGEAPGSASSNNWSFTINQNATTGDAAAIATTILSVSTLDASITANVDIPNNNGADIDLVHQLPLHASWDGSMGDVSLVVDSMTSDMHGLTLYSSCTAATAPYVCNGAAPDASGTTKDGDLHLKWNWSAFDQGTYYLTTVANTTIEGAETTLPADTTTFTIPIQANGNIAVDHTNAANTATFRPTKNTYALAINRLSTASNPLVASVYVTNDGKDSSFMRRLSVDRTDDPTGGASGLTQSDEVQQSNGKNSTDFKVISTAAGKWITLGSTETANNKKDIYFNRLTDSATTPTIEVFASLTDFNLTDNVAFAVDMTDTFTDSTDDAERFGFSFVVRDTTTQIRTLTVSKGNPAGTTKGTIVDDPDFDSDPGDYTIVGADAADTIDQTSIDWIEEGGVGRFYVAFRRATNIVVTKLLSDYNGGYDATTAVLAAGVMQDLDMTSANYQTLDLALGVKGGSTVVAVVYEEHATGRCYFQRFDQSLSTPSTALELTTDLCYHPRVSFNAKSGRFIVTYGLRAADTHYDIAFSEITIGSGIVDTKSADVIVAETGATLYPIKLETAYYPEGDWMAILYRTISTDVIKFHGYHVPGR